MHVVPNEGTRELAAQSAGSLTKGPLNELSERRSSNGFLGMLVKSRAEFMRSQEFNKSRLLSELSLSERTLRRNLREVTLFESVPQPWLRFDNRSYGTFLFDDLIGATEPYSGLRGGQVQNDHIGREFVLTGFSSTHMGFVANYASAFPNGEGGGYIPDELVKKGKEAWGRFLLWYQHEFWAYKPFPNATTGWKGDFGPFGGYWEIGIRNVTMWDIAIFVISLAVGVGYYSFLFGEGTLLGLAITKAGEWLADRLVDDEQANAILSGFGIGVAGSFGDAGGAISKGWKDAGGAISKGWKDAGGAISKGWKDAGGAVSKGWKDATGGIKW